MDPFLLSEDIDRFLHEDLQMGDFTSQAIFQSAEEKVASFICKSDLVVAGMSSVAAMVFFRKNPAIHCGMAAEDGTRAAPGDMILQMKGPVRDLLAAERVSLNLAQRLCGIATLTAQFVQKVTKYPVKITDTRKTTPGLRLLEKYAVRVGGGSNHRFSLSDGILIKDNHITACGSIERAVSMVRSSIPHTMKIEVEAGSLEEVRQCLNCGVDIIMLDNMDIAQMKEAVSLVDRRVLLEASGGVTLQTVEEIAATGVDLISVGALTHSAPASDISMRLETSQGNNLA